MRTLLFGICGGYINCAIRRDVCAISPYFHKRGRHGDSISILLPFFDCRGRIKARPMIRRPEIPRAARYATQDPCGA